MDMGKLIMMANQIARNLALQEGDRAVAATAEHLRLFWEPRMRALIVEHWQQGGEGLDPMARDAVAKLAPSAPA